ncbi:hypothetical protein B1C78_10180 [Thioalkalivibrio denitrificans]|uniref:Uncharacterized protein n=1 Tax=Thioalkalivibrio denitrificans TaxID=108003 RepID=A0A1V3NFD4_9GAMM|nr:hypothetical protein [Thioalkalivibrio denitrificans]OOG23770.1 hypothetical protein B1C78_10180 [Thioalkalivibrio denitrificans]
MIIDNPMAAPPGAPINRPQSNDRLGGGATAAPTESPRPLDDPEEGSAGRRNEEQANTENRPGRNDAEMAARARVDVARERDTEESPQGASEPGPRQDAERMREQLEARLETPTPGGAPQRAVDESI